MPNFFNNDTVTKTSSQLNTLVQSMNMKAFCLDKHHVIQLGCFVIDLTYSAGNAAYKEIH